jgi:hypothetical protein
VERGVKSLKHSQFAKDTILLGGSSTIVGTQFKKFLDLFLKVYGVLVNNNKCQIYAYNFYNLTSRIISKVFYF